jgi:hypothetical protein
MLSNVPKTRRVTDLTTFARQWFTNGVLNASSNNGSPQITRAAHKCGSLDL